MFLIYFMLNLYSYLFAELSSYRSPFAQGKSPTREKKTGNISLFYLGNISVFIPGNIFVLSGKLQYCSSDSQEWRIDLTESARWNLQGCNFGFLLYEQS